MTPMVADQLVLWPDGPTSLPPIDLVNDPDPDGPPEPKMVDLPQWPGFIAHCEWPHDGDVMLDGSHVYTPDEPVDLRCGHCVPVRHVRAQVTGRWQPSREPVRSVNARNPGLVSHLEHQPAPG